MHQGTVINFQLPAGHTRNINGSYDQALCYHNFCLDFYPNSA